MRDKISEGRLLKLHPKCQATFQAFIEEAENHFNVTLRIAQGLRTFEEQQALYDQGRKVKGAIVTNSQAGQSYHNYGLAIDLVRMDNGQPDWGFDMGQLLPMAQKYGIVWGGNFKSMKDKPHFELTYGHNWRELQQMVKDKKVDAHGYVLI